MRPLGMPYPLYDGGWIFKIQLRIVLICWLRCNEGRRFREQHLHRLRN